MVLSTFLSYFPLRKALSKTLKLNLNVRQKVLKIFVNLEEQINNKMFQPGFKPFNERMVCLTREVPLWFGDISTPPVDCW